MAAEWDRIVDWTFRPVYHHQIRYQSSKTVVGANSASWGNNKNNKNAEDEILFTGGKVKRNVFTISRVLSSVQW